MPHKFDISRRLLIGGGLGLFGATMVSAQAAKALLDATSRQDLGPFFPIVRPLEQDADLTRLGPGAKVAKGIMINVVGQVIDRGGRPVPRARIDLWQANAAGRYMHPGDTQDAPLDPDFQGSAVILADEYGHYRFRTIKPGAYPIGGGKVRTPHIHADVRGRRERLVTQMYFPGDPLNETDILFPTADPKQSVIARAVGALGDDPGVTTFAWDIVLAIG